ncbi:unnamed protein product [Meganyctiphanes norvegica]|uniref:RING-type domain-containing protein n=1 Tax=Meganyctiphanes norvegica TaxID=48144 RepID=A0AAV2QIY6_MEGNR
MVSFQLMILMGKMFPWWSLVILGFYGIAKCCIVTITLLVTCIWHCKQHCFGSFSKDKTDTNVNGSWLPTISRSLDGNNCNAEASRRTNHQESVPKSIELGVPYLGAHKAQLDGHPLYAHNGPKKNHMYACNESKYPVCVLNGPENPVEQFNGPKYPVYAHNGPTSEAVSKTSLTYGPVSKILPAQTGSGNTDSTYSEWQGMQEQAQKEMVTKEQSAKELATKKLAPEDQCSICLEALVTRPTGTLTCEHVFHERCIRNWLERQSSCPNCRKIANISYISYITEINPSQGSIISHD